MKKRVKVFEAGEYPQGEFTKDKVQSIFGNVKGKIQGIYAHTSKWKDKEPVVIGEFSNFGVENGKAYADLELNDKGKGYYEDGIFKGISAEIGKTLSKIAVLPVGVKPAVAGAEFENCEDLIMEFEESEEEMTLEKILEAMKELKLEDRLELIREIAQSITPTQKAAFRAVQYEFQQAVKEGNMTKEELLEFAKKEGFEIEIKEKQEPKSEEQIREEIKAEFEAERQAESDLAEFEKLVDKKVLPAHKEAYMEAYKASQGKEELIEFEEGKEKITKSAHLKDVVSGMSDLNLTQEFAKKENKEELSEREKAVKRMQDAKKRAEGAK